MGRRRVLLLGSAAVVVVGLAIGVWTLWPRTAITEENAAKLRPGMTLAEVEAILGGPARIETTGPTRANADMENSGGSNSCCSGRTANAARSPGIPIPSLSTRCVARSGA